MSLRTLSLVAAFASQALAEPGGWSPTEAVKRMKPADGLEVRLFAAEPDVRQPIFVKCDDRGRVWTIQYLQYPNPAGLKRVKVDRWSRTVYDRLPEPPPRGPKGDDRITICEDSDGDGKADKFKDFVSGLNLCTGLEFGHEGVYVLQAPYLLYYADRNHDDIPDGDPAVLLTGFGMEDAQSLANHLTWGPDGWLYGLNGSTTTCKIRGIEFQQGVWRYQPVTKEFELFCEGGGNVFGLTFDDHGNLFYSSNLGLFWHARQGAYFMKNVGKHGPLHNPYAYGHLMHVAHDAATGGPTTGGVVYRGDSFPERFRGRFLAGDFLRHTASTWELKPSGSTVTAAARELLLDSQDAWFGATDLCLGPDGSVYLSDFYDKRTAHPDPDADWDRSNGRIYKIQATNTKPPAKFDLNKLSTTELVELLKHPNGWFGDRARVLLAGRQDKTAWPALKEMAKQKDARLALRGLWALHVTGGVDESFALDLTRHPAEQVRAWAVRLFGEFKKVTDVYAWKLSELARDERSPVVLAQLACTAKRLPGFQGRQVIEQLLLRDTDADTSWLIWWALESKAITEYRGLSEFFYRHRDDQGDNVMPNARRLMRRYAAEGTAGGYRNALEWLTLFPDKERPALLAELDRGLAERSAGLPRVGQGGLFDNLAVPGSPPDKPARKSDPPEDTLAGNMRVLWRQEPENAVRTRLAIRCGITAARDRVHSEIANPQTSAPLLRERLGILEELGDATCVPVVLPLLSTSDNDTRQRILIILGRLGGKDTGEAIVKAYPRLPTAIKPKARETLFARTEWASLFLKLVDAKTVLPSDVPVEEVRLLALLGDKDIDAAVRKHWGSIRPGTPEEKLAEMRRFSNDLRAGPGDAVRGKVLFAKNCAVCHKLFGEGGTVGPEITNTSRADTAWLLASIVDPSAVIRSQYVQHALATTDGALRTGIIAEQDGASVTLIDAKAEKTRIPRDRIESLRELPTSLMPEKILDALAPQERRDLFKYLQQPGK